MGGPIPGSTPHGAFYVNGAAWGGTLSSPSWSPSSGSLGDATSEWGLSWASRGSLLTNQHLLKAKLELA